MAVQQIFIWLSNKPQGNLIAIWAIANSSAAMSKMSGASRKRPMRRRLQRGIATCGQDFRPECLRIGFERLRSLNPTARAICLLCLAALGYTLNDTFTKFLIERYPLLIIIFVRSVMALPLLALMAGLISGEVVRWPRSIWPHAIRGAVGLMAASLYIMGLGTLSVAEATVIVFASPLFVTAASSLIFGERVGWRKWASVIISFLGVIVAISPGTASFKPASLFVLASALLYATLSLSARWVHPEDNFWSVSSLARRSQPFLLLRSPSASGGYFI